MPLSGTKPADTPTRRRNRPTHDWTEIDAVPFADAPALGGRWSKRTATWWHAVSTMPHCILWDDSDWQFAFDTALVAAAFHRGDLRQASELRRRERIMGTTVDSRRDLRIRYVESTVEPDDPAITAIADYRKALEDW